MEKKNIVLSFLGTQLDSLAKRSKKERWRPNLGLVSQPDWHVDELNLLYSKDFNRLAVRVVSDIERASPQTQVSLQQMEMDDPWDFEEVYAKLFDWCQQYNFDVDANNYYFHISTGTHVAQICSYLLTESRHFPGRLIQTGPGRSEEARIRGEVQVIDLDLSRYDQIATRFDTEHLQGEQFLKGGIATRNTRFNRLISQVEKVAIRSSAPILLTGPTGSGKSQLAKRIYQLKKQRSSVTGELVSVNCATLRGENAMAALFGHTKGAFTGAQKSRHGFLLSADKGVLFLDEIGELGLEEQAMLLHAIEHKTFHPVGSDSLVSSDFQLIAGTNRYLKHEVREGRFREDLLARINLWTYELPALRERKEDIAPNIDYELLQYSENHGRRVQFSREARLRFLAFATSNQGVWAGNFRDLSSAITRLCTLADMSRITEADVDDEIERLTQAWRNENEGAEINDILSQYFSEEALALIDTFDKHQLSYVLKVCEQHTSIAGAGRELFDYSRTLKTKANDSSRLQKYLQKFGINNDMLRGRAD